MSDPYDRQQAAAAMSDRPEPAAQAEASALARHGDPSLQRRKTDGAYVSPEDRRRGGIEWVRASDLLTRGGIRVADRGAGGQENVVRRMRGGMASINPISRRGIARRSANSLPPPSAFGATPPSSPAAGRGVGGR
jgi:hypothetical protein